MEDEKEVIRRVEPKCLEEIPSGILWETDDYIVIDKPADIRMDGPHEVTVEKVVPKWISLKDGTSDTPPVLKWVHQLDYATSGVLAIARSRSAAAAATHAFEVRSTKKAYLAVLQGHLNMKDLRCPRLNAVHSSTGAGSLSHDPNRLYSERKEAKRSRLDTDSAAVNAVQKSGVMTGNTAADPGSWQETVMLENLNRCMVAIAGVDATLHGDLPSEESLSNTPIDSRSLAKANLATQIRRMQLCSKEDFIACWRLRKLLRRVLSRSGIEVELLESTEAPIVAQGAELSIEKAADNINDDLPKESPLSLDEVDALCASYRSIAASRSLSSDENPGPLYVVTNATTLDVTGVSGTNDTPVHERLIIDVPVAELTSSFRMELGHPGNEGRPAVTELTVLGCGTYLGQPVTKVCLRPLTGRRHQLRLHSLLLGHPIVGDFTYNRYHRRECAAAKVEAKLLHTEATQYDISSAVNNAIKEEGGFDEALIHAPYSSNVRKTAERMMLHAWQLSIPPPKTKLARGMTRYPSTLHPELGEVLVQCVAPDPFLFDNNVLNPVLPVYAKSSVN